MRMRRLSIVSITLAFAAPALMAANIPRKAPDFAIHLVNRQQISLGQYRGKVVALAFVLTSCPHCQQAVSCLVQEQKTLGPRGFQAVASAIEEMAQVNLPDYLRRTNAPFPIGYNELRPVLDFMQHPPMVGPRMPMVAFLDRAGNVRAQYEGYEAFLAKENMAANIHSKLLELLKEGGSAVRKARKK